MKTIPSALATHLAGDSWTLATIWAITRVDSTVYRFTDHDTDLVVSGNTYKAAVGYQLSAIKHGIDVSPDNIEATGIIDDAGIKETELLGGLFDGASVEVSLVNYNSPADGTIPLLNDRIGEVSTEEGQFRAELMGLAHRATKHIGRLITPGCPADLGDSDCGVNLATYTVTGTVPGSYQIDAVRWTFSEWVNQLVDGVWIYELEVRPSAGGADQCTPSSNASANEYRGTFTPDLAFDDDSGTRWVSNAGASPDWLKFDFSSAAEIYEYRLRVPSGDYRPLDWIVEVQLAGETAWTLIDSEANYSWTTYNEVFVVTRPSGTKTGSKISFFDGDRTEADDYWKGGKIIWTSGPNAGLSQDIKQSTAAGVIVFWEPMPFEIEVGDGYSITPGCGKDENACKGYSNFVNFQGFPHLRGLPDLIRGPE